MGGEICIAGSNAEVISCIKSSSKFWRSSLRRSEGPGVLSNFGESAREDIWRQRFWSLLMFLRALLVEVSSNFFLGLSVWS